MTYRKLTPLCIIAIILMGCGASTQRKTPKALFIIVDGIPADVLETLNPPTLDEIKNVGGYTRSYVGGIKDSYNQTPTISAPGYMCVITGTWGNKHNVWDNDVADPNYNYWNIFRIVEETKPALRTSIFSTWEDNRTKLIGEDLEQAGSIQLDYKFDGLELDTMKYTHDSESDYILKIDEAVSEEAARYITTDGPDVTWVYLQYTDDMGHKYGDSPKFHDAIKKADANIGKIWAAIKDREQKYSEDWLIVITTDHGRDAATGKNHGGQSDRERATWIVTNSDVVNARFKQSPAAVDILPSILKHLGLPIPPNIQGEIDGVPFIGEIDLADLKAEINGDTVNLQWKNFSIEDTAKAEILFTRTNFFKQGRSDEYQKAGEVFLKDERFTFVLRNDSSFAKVVVKAPHHCANVWLSEPKK
jgi:predicted AlkP superfamily pyrophosphatase or phosphodiesterase